MANVTYEKDISALLVVDPYNDFISEGGKVWDRLKGIAEANQCVPHMLQVLDAARKSDIRVFYALHRRYRPGDYETWKYIAPIQKAAWSRKTFEAAKPAQTKEGTTPRAESKGAKILELIGRPKGATIAEIVKATNWQKHSIRGFLSTAAKKHGLKIDSTKAEGGERVYQIKK
jgi:nicotinamidase-related amidase